MHDGAVVFDTKLNNKQLEKDYAKTIRKIQDMEGEISIKSARRNALVDQAKEMGVQLDIAKAKLYEMQSASKGIFSTEEVQMQQENVKILQSQWNDINNQVESYDRWLKNADDKLDGQRKKAVRLTEELEKANSAEARFADTAETAEVRITRLTDRIGKLATRALVFTVISQGFRLMRDWLGEVIKKDDETTASIARLKGALLTMAQPLVEVVLPVFRFFVDLLTVVIGKIAAFLSMLSGKTVQQTAKNAKALNSQASATEALGDAAEKASGQLAGFDEINRLEDTSVSTSVGSGATVENGEIVPDFSWLEEIPESVENTIPDFSWIEGVSESMDKIADCVLGIAAGLALWKIGSYFTGPLGAIVTTLGRVVAGVSLVALGITLLVEAFQDAEKNGWNLSNTLLAVAGIVATGLGLSILTHSWIPLLVAGIASVLLAITTLTGHGGELIDGFKTLFGGFADFVGGIFTGDMERAAKGVEDIWNGALMIIDSVISGLLDAAEKAFSRLWESVKSWVERIAEQWNSIWNSISSYHYSGVIPDMSYNITAYGIPEIPALAQGAVIPPNREFLAVLGDQRSGTNIEAPLETIKQALSEVLSQQGGGDITINFTGDLAQLARILTPEITYEQNSAARAGGW